LLNKFELHWPHKSIVPKRFYSDFKANKTHKILNSLFPRRALTIFFSDYKTEFVCKLSWHESNSCVGTYPFEYLRIGDTESNKNCANNFLIQIAACNFPQQYVYQILLTVQRGVYAIRSTRNNAYCACFGFLTSFQCNFLISRLSLIFNPIIPCTHWSIISNNCSQRER